MFTSQIEFYLNWFTQHSALSHTLTYSVCLVSCLAGIGILVPTSIILASIGTLIGLGKLPFASTILCAIIGALTGSSISFWVGTFYQEDLREQWIFQTYPKILQQGEYFFQRFGKTSVFIARFIGPSRAIVPIIAGMTGMQPRYFFVADISSAILWPFLYVLPGVYLVEHSSIIMACLHPVWLLYITTSFLMAHILWRFFKRYYGNHINWIKQHMMNKPWHLLKTNTVVKMMKTSFSMKTNTNYYALSIKLLLSVALFWVILLNVLQQGPLTQWNGFIHDYMKTLRSPIWDKFWVTITLLNGFAFTGFFTIVSLWLVFKKDVWRMLHWAALGIIILGLTEGLKYGLAIPRPNDILVPVTRGAFPSGHVTSNATLLGGFILLLNLQTRTLAYRFIHSIYTIWVGLVAFSRLYLGAHWITDIMGALLLSIGTLTLVELSYTRKLTALKHRREFVIVALITLTLLWIARFILKYQKLLIAHTPL